MSTVNNDDGDSSGGVDSTTVEESRSWLQRIGLIILLVAVVASLINILSLSSQRPEVVNSG